MPYLHGFLGVPTLGVGAEIGCNAILCGRFVGCRSDLPDPSVNASESFDDILHLGHYQKQSLMEPGHMLFRAFTAKCHRNFVSPMKS